MPKEDGVAVVSVVAVFTLGGAVLALRGDAVPPPLLCPIEKEGAGISVIFVVPPIAATKIFNFLRGGGLVASHPLEW